MPAQSTIIDNSSFGATDGIVVNDPPGTYAFTYRDGTWTGLTDSLIPNPPVELKKNNNLEYLEIKDRSIEID